MDKNKKALADRGWNPLNRNCMDDPEVLASAPKEVKAERDRILALRNPSAVTTVDSDRSAVVPAHETALAPVETLNLTDGFMGELMGSLLQAYEAKDGRNKLQEQRIAAGKAKDALKEARRITAGVVFFSMHNSRSCAAGRRFLATIPFQPQRNRSSAGTGK